MKSENEGTYFVNPINMNQPRCRFYHEKYILEYALGAVYLMERTNLLQSKFCSTSSFTPHSLTIETIDFRIRHRCDCDQSIQFCHRHHNVCILLRLRSVTSSCKCSLNLYRPVM